MLPILFTIPKIAGYGPFPIHTYGVVMVIAFAAALWLSKRRAVRFGIAPGKIADASFWALITGILGARVVFILQDLPYYTKHIDELLSLRFAGLTSFGGPLVGLPVLVVWAKRNSVSFPRLLDAIAPGFAIGTIIGRFGCLMNGCCYGGACDPSFFLATHFDGAPGFHQPAQMYDAALNLIGLIGLFWLERKNVFRIGQAAAYYVGVYGMSRFIYEFWRAGTDREVQLGIATSTRIPGTPLTEAQVVALVLVAISLIWMWFARRNEPEFVIPTPSSPPESDLQPAPG